MFSLPNWLTSRIPASSTRNGSAASSSSSSNSADSTLANVFYPSFDDVETVRGLLLRPLWRQDHRSSRGLPPELINMILDWAEYWPSAYAEMEEDEHIIAQDRDSVLVTTPPLCYDMKALVRGDTTCLFHRTQRPCRKIVFNLSSHDQGWGGGEPDTFEGSFTWFDVEA
ncbi:Phosphotransferase enzyme, partial [Ascosphaera pollenicola]